MYKPELAYAGPGEDVPCEIALEEGSILLLLGVREGGRGAWADSFVEVIIDFRGGNLAVLLK